MEHDLRGNISVTIIAILTTVHSGYTAHHRIPMISKLLEITHFMRYHSRFLLFSQFIKYLLCFM